MTFLLANWRLVLLGLLVAAVGIQTWRLKATQEEFEEFRIAVEVAGRVQEEQTKARIAEERADKEKADAENMRTTNKLRADIARLRLERSGSGFLPAAAATTASPDRAAFDRAELERALRDLDQGVQGLVDEGSKAIVDLNTARQWARDLP